MISEGVRGGEAIVGFRRYVSVGKRVVAVDAPYASRSAAMLVSNLYFSNQRHTINPIIIYRISIRLIDKREEERTIP